ncbi:hypothetical protein KY328_05830 [Candidatus Woesearchaeota archaeon]|nr:hypothetical protein [Candidatus Woesearchaeota archaeon]MBW3022419.1 hypothetical protein [Candidatus Woesearchaeota archaeon]
MSVKINLGEKKLVPLLRFSGIFDFDGLYKLMVNWFMDRNYDFYEPLYKDKPGDAGREVEIEWKSEKKIDEFYKYIVEVFFHLWDVQPVEVILEGEKKLLTKARMEIRIVGTLEADYQNRWSRSDFRVKLLSFYINHIIMKRLELYVLDPFYYRLYDLHTMVKDFLNMSTKGSAY